MCRRREQTAEGPIVFSAVVKTCAHAGHNDRRFALTRQLRCIRLSPQDALPAAAAAVTRLKGTGWAEGEQDKITFDNRYTTAAKDSTMTI